MSLITLCSYKKKKILELVFFLFFFVIFGLTAGTEDATPLFAAGSPDLHRLQILERRVIYFFISFIDV